MWTVHASTPYGLSGWLHEIVDEDGVCVTVAETHVGLGTPWTCLEDGCEAFSFCPHVRAASEMVTLARGDAECTDSLTSTGGANAATARCATGYSGATPPPLRSRISANAGSTAPLPSGTAPLRAKNPRRTRKQREALFREAQANLPGWMQGQSEHLTTWLREVQTSD